MDDAVRRQKMIQDRIADGRLPNNKIGRVSATYGTGEACDACSLAVSTEQVLYRLGRLGVQELIFHNACFEELSRRSAIGLDRPRKSGSRCRWLN